MSRFDQRLSFPKPFHITWADDETASVTLEAGEYTFDELVASLNEWFAAEKQKK